jgi:DNA-binding FrmR family transcriptional regulator
MTGERGLDKYPMGVYNEAIRKNEGGCSMSEKEHSCCCGDEKHTVRTEEQKKKLLNRLNRLEGQVRGVKKMIENDAYCNDVLVQTAAISAAVNALSREVLRAHLNSCVIRDIRAGRDEVTDELMETLERIMR